MIISNQEIERRITRNRELRRQWANRVIIGALQGLTPPPQNWQAIYAQSDREVDAVDEAMARQFPEGHQTFTRDDFEKFLARMNAAHAREVLKRATALVTLL